jgi:hypothetical protein
MGLPGSRDQHPDENPEAQQNGDHAPPEEGPFLLFLHDLLPWNKDIQNRLDPTDPFRFLNLIYYTNTESYDLD